jgi:hypothetical protein
MAPAADSSRRGRRRVLHGLLAGAAILAVTLLVANVLGDVAIFYAGSTTLGGAKSPMRFINGGNYASASAEGFVTVTYPTTQQVGLTAAVKSADGAYGTYLLDVVEVEALTNSTSTWDLRLDVVTALVATGVNAAWVFDCTVAPTAVPDSGTPLGSGTDSSGDAWAIFAPTCAGSQESLSMLAAGTGTTIALPKLVYASSILFLSFGVAVASGGATTTTAATLVLSILSP